MDTPGVGAHWQEGSDDTAVRPDPSLLREIAELDERLASIARAVDIVYERCDAVLRRPPMEALLAERADGPTASLDSHAVSRLRQLQEMAHGIHLRLDEFASRVQL